jgi:hypothetical protein
LEPQGDFTCGDTVFKWAWKAGQHTIQCSTVDAWADCPWREQGMYLGDNYVEWKANRCYQRSPAYVRRALRLWAQGQADNGQMFAAVPGWLRNQHPDFTLIYILYLHDYWADSGDAELVRELWPAVERIWRSSLWQPGSGGLWNAEGLNVFGDWGATKESVNGEANGILNAFRIGALQASAALADLLAQSDRADAFRREADRVTQTFRELLWDANKNAFAACCSGGNLSTTQSHHANILALRFGIPTQSQIPGVLDYVLRGLRENMVNLPAKSNRGGHIDLYFQYYALETLAELGHAAEAEEAIRFHAGLQMQSGTPTLWESYARGSHGLGSQCHGWSSAPMIYFCRRLLGIRQAESGNPRRFVVQPESATLAWAKGRYPLSGGGALEVEWQVVGNEFHLDVQAPAGVEVRASPGPTFRHLRPRVRVVREE